MKPLHDELVKKYGPSVFKVSIMSVAETKLPPDFLAMAQPYMTDFMWVGFFLGYNVGNGSRKLEAATTANA